jgi:UDPglucose 6-dehydrogenase
LSQKILKYFGKNLKGRTIGIWGLSFKPQTDDMREAPSLVVIRELIAAGARIKAYDPAAMTEARHKLGDSILYAKDMYEAVIDADALAIVTEWPEFRVPNYKVMAKLMIHKLIFDGRNIYDPSEMKENGFIYYSIGRAPINVPT